jgi:ATP-dependent DNA ligase
VKTDGWRALVGWDGHAIGLVTRNFNPIRCGRELRSEMARLFRGVEQLTILDAEWLLPAGTPVFEDRLSVGPERLILFDMLAADGAWIGELPAGERFKQLTRFWKAHGKRMRRIQLVPCTTRDYDHAFAATRNHPGAEGVVLKHVESRYIGSTESSATNPKWLKVKWPGQPSSSSKPISSAKRHTAE